jgi:hypothetical protein
LEETVRRTQLLNWTSDTEFSAGGINFVSTIDPAVFHTRESTETDFLLVKDRGMIDCEIDAVEGAQVRNIVDIGIWQGGSVVLLDLVFAPQKLVALEYSERPLPPLDRYISSRGRAGAISVYKGMNQADSVRLRKIVADEFKGAPLDLVIDDASHFYEESRESFDVLFPHLRPGGKFIIEDWQWSAVPKYADLEYFKGKPGLANLVLQCMVVCAARPDIISLVEVTPYMAIVTRGSAPDLGDFRIADLAVNRGAKVPLIL